MGLELLALLLTGHEAGRAGIGLHDRGDVLPPLGIEAGTAVPAAPVQAGDRNDGPVGE